MNDFILGFKNAAHLAGEICGFSNGKIIREFGLNDFLENSIQTQDDAQTICVKALGFFCDEPDPNLGVFKFGVLTVGSFLNNNVAKQGKMPPQVAMRDLVSVLSAKANEQQIGAWIATHFG